MGKLTVPNYLRSHNLMRSRIVREDIRAAEKDELGFAGYGIQRFAAQCWLRGTSGVLAHYTLILEVSGAGVRVL